MRGVLTVGIGEDGAVRTPRPTFAKDRGVPAVFRAKKGDFRPKLALYGPETVASGPGKYDPDTAKVGLGA